jgi:hypothetical protein
MSDCDLFGEPIARAAVAASRKIYGSGKRHTAWRSPLYDDIKSERGQQDRFYADSSSACCRPTRRHGDTRVCALVAHQVGPWVDLFLEHAFDFIHREIGDHRGPGIAGRRALRSCAGSLHHRQNRMLCGAPQTLATTTRRRLAPSTPAPERAERHNALF